MCNAGISKGESVTSIRAAAITRAFQLGASAEDVNRWPRHSNTAAMIQKYYDKNWNDNIRNLLSL